jgi:integrase
MSHGILCFAEFMQNFSKQGCCAMPKITRESLTKQRVDSTRPSDRVNVLRDSTVPGLVLRVAPTGLKSWAVTWGRGQARNLGRFPIMTLDGARSAARKVLGEIEDHGKPLAALLADQAAHAQHAARTFGEFMRDSYGPHVEATAKAGKATVACIEKQFFHLYDHNLSDITRSAFDAFKAKRLKASTHPATVNRDLDRIKAALSKAVEWGMLPANPLLGVKRIKRDIEERVRYLSPKEELRLRKALDSREAKFRKRRQDGNSWRNERARKLLPELVGYVDHVMPMTLLALNTGLRRGEITQLCWSDVDLIAKRITVRAGYAKSGKARHVPLNSEVVKVLKRYRQQHNGKGELFDVTSIATAWAGLMTLAKIELFRFHDLRHTFASKLVMAGVDLNTVRELLGHGDIKMTLRYAHLAPEHQAAAVEKLVKK